MRQMPSFWRSHDHGGHTLCTTTPVSLRAPCRLEATKPVRPTPAPNDLPLWLPCPRRHGRAWRGHGGRAVGQSVVAADQVEPQVVASESERSCHLPIGQRPSHVHCGCCLFHPECVVIGCVTRKCALDPMLTAVDRLSRSSCRSLVHQGFVSPHTCPCDRTWTEISLRGAGDLAKLGSDSPDSTFAAHSDPHLILRGNHIDRDLAHPIHY
jgi:hypothetical protein